MTIQKLEKKTVRSKILLLQKLALVRLKLCVTGYDSTVQWSEMLTELKTKCKTQMFKGYELKKTFKE